jgi:hypothetical protein
MDETHEESLLRKTQLIWAILPQILQNNNR